MGKCVYSAPSVKKAFKILSAVSETPGGLGITDLSKKLKIGKSTILGVTTALEESGALTRDPVHKRYTLGYSLLELCRAAHRRIELKDIARKSMEELMEKIGETVFLGVLNGDHVTILDVVESRNMMKITAPPGTRLPLLVGATGRVLLGQIGTEKAKVLLQEAGLVRYTSRSVVDPKQFLKEAMKAKESGFAIDDEEYIQGIRAVASPLGEGHAPAAIWVVGFTSTMDDPKVEMTVAEIQKAAREIRQSLRAAETQGGF